MFIEKLLRDPTKSYWNRGPRVEMRSETMH